MPHQEARILRVGDVMRMANISRATVTRMINRGDMPAPVNIGVKALTWHRGDIDEWLSGTWMPEGKDSAAA